MNHVSVSPTNGNEPTQEQRKTPTRVGIEPTTFGLDSRCSTGLSYKVGREQIVGIEDLKFAALNRVQVVYKRLRFMCSTYISTELNVTPCTRPAPV